MTVTTKRMTKMVDELGAINAQIAKLQAEADGIKTILKASGADEVVGKMFRAVITTSTSNVVDSKKLREIMGDAIPTKQVNRTSVSLFDM